MLHAKKIISPPEGGTSLNIHPHKYATEPEGHKSRLRTGAISASDLVATGLLRSWQFNAVRVRKSAPEEQNKQSRLSSLKGEVLGSGYAFKQSVYTELREKNNSRLYAKMRWLATNILLVVICYLWCHVFQLQVHMYVLFWGFKWISQLVVLFSAPLVPMLLVSDTTNH